MLKETTQKKYTQLQEILKSLKRVIIAFSGGVDSTFLAYTAAQVLGKENVLAVTANSETYPADELQFAKNFVTEHGIPHRVITTCELEEINSRGNPKNRCYHCKKELFSSLKEIAEQEKYAVLEGSNLDDNKDYRPGSQAARELNVYSPLRDAELSKEEIREISKELQLPTWDKPAYACLTSRFPYNVEIKEEELRRVEKAEQFLHAEGFRQCRVRNYGTKARIEVSADKVDEALKNSEAIISRLLSLGYTEVEIDPSGYKMGSMNTFNKG